MAKRQYTHRSLEHWQAHIDAQAQSALSVSDYCQQHQLTPSNFYAWRKKLNANVVGDNTDVTENSWIALSPHALSKAQAATEITLALPGGIQLTLRS